MWALHATPGLVLLAFLCALLPVRPGRAADASGPVGAAPRQERVVEIARRTASTISGASSLRVRADMAYDAVQADGEAIEFGATRIFSIRRPDHARVETVDRAGARTLFVYDGEALVLADESHDVYATAAFTGDLDSMQAYARQELGVPTPLSEFVSPGLFEILDTSESARWVDSVTLDGVLCDHLAFRNASRGLQIWVPREGKPLPRRVVITYEDAPGRPQFRANLRDWSLSLDLADSLFTFMPAPDAERIYFNSSSGILPGLPIEPGPQ